MRGFFGVGGFCCIVLVFVIVIFIVKLLFFVFYIEVCFVCYFVFVDVILVVVFGGVWVICVYGFRFGVFLEFVIVIDIVLVLYVVVCVVEDRLVVVRFVVNVIGVVVGVRIN